MVFECCKYQITIIRIIKPFQLTIFSFFMGDVCNVPAYIKVGELSLYQFLLS